MPLKIENTSLQNVLLGESSVDKVLVGSSQVWPDGAPPENKGWTDIIRYENISHFQDLSGGGTLTLTPDGTKIIGVYQSNGTTGLDFRVIPLNEPYYPDWGTGAASEYFYSDTNLLSGSFFSPTGSHLFTWTFTRVNPTGTTHIRCYELNGPFDVSVEPTLLNSGVFLPVAMEGLEPVPLGISADGLTLYWQDPDADAICTATLPAPFSLLGFTGTVSSSLSIPQATGQTIIAMTPDARYVMYSDWSFPESFKTYEMSVPGDLSTATLVANPEFTHYGYNIYTPGVHSNNVTIPDNNWVFGGGDISGFIVTNADWGGGIEILFGITGSTEW